VRQAAGELKDEIEFLCWLQWIAERPLRWGQDTLRSRGFCLGLYRDMAVGCDRSGAETWSAPDDFIANTLVGAPPDVLNPGGQNWGLPPLNPSTMRKKGYAAFVDLVRSNMRHSGALRIDHAMGLQRLYCIPEGCTAGAYVEYPLDDLIGILALESHRNKCVVIGEDLGTVPEGFRERMQDSAVLSYRVLFFEFDEAGALAAPESYPSLSMAVAGSHDMATIKGWFDAADLRLKRDLKLYASQPEYLVQVDARVKERAAVAQAMRKSELAADPVSSVHSLLDRTRSVLRLFQLDDLLGEYDPVNIPATTTEYPNWRRKYSVEIEQIDAAWDLLPPSYR